MQLVAGYQIALVMANSAVALYICLFVVLGVFWSLQIFSQIFAGYSLHDKSYLHGHT